MQFEAAQRISARVRLMVLLAAIGFLSACVEVDNTPARLQDDNAVVAPQPLVLKAA